MSIRQKRTMTEKSLEAHRRNARQSRGPVTEEGKKHSRDANISHGFMPRTAEPPWWRWGKIPGNIRAWRRR